MPLFKKNKKEKVVKEAPRVDSDGDEVDATEEGIGGPQGKANESGEINYTEVDVGIPRTQFIEGQGPSVTVEKQSRTVEKDGTTYTTVVTTKSQSGSVQYDTTPQYDPSAQPPPQQQPYRQPYQQQPQPTYQPQQGYPMQAVSYQGGYSGPYTHGASYGDMYDRPPQTLKAPGFDYINWKPIGYRRKKHNGKEDFFRQAYLLAPYVKAVVASGCEGAKEREGQSYTQAPPPPALGPRTPGGDMTPMLAASQPMASM